MALVTEGDSDDRFLGHILHRSAQEMCGSVADLPEPMPVRVAAGPGGRAALVKALDDRDGAFNLIVYHRDGKTHPDRERETWFGPFRHACEQAGRTEPLVPVVPVQETEAWALADGEALRTVLDIDWTDSRLGIPARARDVERISRPKETLQDLARQVSRWDVNHLTTLGQCVSLERLRELPAFRRWENDLAEALQTLPGFVKR